MIDIYNERCEHIDLPASVCDGEGFSDGWLKVVLRIDLGIALDAEFDIESRLQRAPVEAAGFGDAGDGEVGNFSDCVSEADALGFLHLGIKIFGACECGEADLVSVQVELAGFFIKRAFLGAHGVRPTVRFPDIFFGKPHDGLQVVRVHIELACYLVVNALAEFKVAAIVSVFVHGVFHTGFLLWQDAPLFDFVRVEQAAKVACSPHIDGGSQCPPSEVACKVWSLRALGLT